MERKTISLWCGQYDQAVSHRFLWNIWKDMLLKVMELFVDIP